MFFKKLGSKIATSVLMSRSGSIVASLTGVSPRELPGPVYEKLSEFIAGIEQDVLAGHQDPLNDHEGAFLQLFFIERVLEGNEHGSFTVERFRNARTRLFSDHKDKIRGDISFLPFTT
ncbi:hypothetical protein [Lysobacter soyae]|uniref:Uncharacterized protein n=1 Tax=Lysobacter soyae TaxID=2764185 RepID=A0ABX8WP07_9GAMM|nr:hypothetical protein [Lysobacter sp. CJ11]QYR52955.1 hypothetical protein H8L67_00035 [Lysobacter sp. CJ11]